MIGPTARQNVTSTGNETFNKFLGGGILDSSLNIFERQGPTSRILDPVWNRLFVASTLIKQGAIIYVNFNTSIKVDELSIKRNLPTFRDVKSELMYKDIRGRSAAAKIKIAWRYSSRGVSSPSDGINRMEQVDYGLARSDDAEIYSVKRIRVLNVDSSSTFEQTITKIKQIITQLKKEHQRVSIVVKDLMHPFSPMIDDSQSLVKFVYALRCLSRILEKGAILMSYDRDMCSSYGDFQRHLYNIADCVVSFHSYETGENKLTGYKSIDGTLNYVKVPKINSFGFHFQQDISDWGYRFTKNHRFFVIDELSLPPCDDNNDKRETQPATRWTNIENTSKPLEQVGPLEEFREIAKDVLSKKL